MLISGVLYGRCLLAPAADSGLCAFSGIIGCSSPKLRKSHSVVPGGGITLQRVVELIVSSTPCTATPPATLEVLREQTGEMEQDDVNIPSWCFQSDCEHTSGEHGPPARGVQVRPGQRDHLRSSQTSASCKQDHNAIANRELCHKSLELKGSQNILLSKTHRRSTDLADGVESEPLLTDRMAIKNGERGPDLCLRCRHERQRIQPFLDLNGTH